MKKRSEVAAMKKRSEVVSEKKTSAEERTVPLPGVGGVYECEACEAKIPAEKIIHNGDKLECPECGAKIEGALSSDALSTSAGKDEDKFVDPHPERKWCGECATELTILTSGPMKGINFPCGHGNAERVDDPRKAKRVSPAAGLQTRTRVEVEKRNEEDKTSAKKDTGRDTSALNVSPPTPMVSVEGDRISVMWGKSTFPLAMMSNFSVGEFFVSKILPPGADRVQAAREILSDIEKIADEAFARQRSWYEKKLGSLNE